MVEVYADHPVTCDVQRSCLHARRYPQSGYEAWFWFTTLFLRDNGCGGCPTSLHTIGRQQITDLLSMCDGHVRAFSSCWISITKACPIWPLLQPLNLDNIWSHSVFLRSAVINTSRWSIQLMHLPCLRTNKAGSLWQCTKSSLCNN